MEMGDIARDLHMNEETVRAAFAYWEKNELVRVLSAKPLALEYVNLKHKFIGGTKSQELKRNRVFAELSQQVQQIFSGKRVLSTTEFSRMYDWFEVLHFEQAAIAPLVAWCVKQKGERVSFAYLDTVMMSLAEKGVTTAEEADRWIRSQEAMSSGAAKVLSRWSLRRAPTVDEMDLYEKWTGPWGFTEDAVIAACREITATDKPNFKYLDAILASFHAEGLTTARAILQGIDDRKRRREMCADITKALGLRASVSNATELLRLYEHFTSLGFTDSAILMAATMLAIEGRHTLADLAARLNAWYEDGTVSDEALAERGQRDGEASLAVKRWLGLWGQSRSPSPGELAAYARFHDEWSMPDDLIDFAAERSALADRPLAMMGRLLEGWRDRGIRDRKAAHEDWEKGRAASQQPEKTFSNQRTYSQEQLDGMKTGLFDLKDL